jgi:hypothetical protein
MMVSHRKKRRNLMKTTLVVLFLTIALGTTFATTTDQLQITVGSATATITDNGACAGTGCGSLSGDINLTNGTITVDGIISGWSITYTSGTSYSPSDVPVGLDTGTGTELIACAGITCAGSTLNILFSDINFSPANPSFLTQYSATISGTGTGHTSESAYFSNLNTQFAETTLIGTVGPFSATGSGSQTGGVGSSAPYSLTLAETFYAATANSIVFSVDGSVSSVVPEPMSLLLLGGCLLVVGRKLAARML